MIADESQPDSINCDQKAENTFTKKYKLLLTRRHMKLMNLSFNGWIKNQIL